MFDYVRGRTPGSWTFSLVEPSRLAVDDVILHPATQAQNAASQDFRDLGKRVNLSGEVKGATPELPWVGREHIGRRTAGLDA